MVPGWVPSRRESSTISTSKVPLVRPAGMTATLARVRLHAARPQGVNEPTAEEVDARNRARLRAADPERYAVNDLAPEFFWDLRVELGAR